MTVNTEKALVRLLILLFQFKCFIIVQGGERNFTTRDQEWIDSLREYEFVCLQLNNSLSPLGTSESPVLKEGKTLVFRFRGENLSLKLHFNRNLFSPNYFERYIAENGLEVTKKNSHFCFFHGHVEGHEGESIAAISTCDGVNGYFTLNGKTYLIQPVKSIEGEVFHIVFEAERVNLTRYKCGHNDSKPIDMDFASTSYRVRRDVLSETKYLEMVIVNDRSQYLAYGENTTMRTKTLANILDSVYRVHKIRVVLIMIETWKHSDKITVNPNDEQKTLEDFEQYKANVLDKDENTKNDNAQLLTHITFHSSIVGKASSLSICSTTSAAVTRDHSPNAALTASTMAHELGHNFGFDHDEDFTNCTCEQTAGCLMAQALMYTPLLKLSSCSQETLKNTLLSNYGTCLFDQPTKYIREPECGNAFIDDGEQCDCGTKEDCELVDNNCCNYTTCHLHPNTECSDGPCCDNCQLKRRGTICREKVNDCDLPEYCDGKSHLCAPDSYVHNGRSCGSGKSLCYLGVCHTHDSQCQTFWGPSSRKGHFYCYRYLNTRGDVWGHCKKLPDGSYQRCEQKDQYCGKLQCENPGGKSWLPNIGTNRKAHSINVGSETCWSGVVYMGDDVPEPGMVQTGTECDTDKVCVNNTCVDINVAFSQPLCSHNCSGNGICNNLGHCHCNYGYRCPDCKEACSGDGGSLDSGNGCDCVDPNATVSTMIFTNATTTPTAPTTITNSTPPVSENATIQTKSSSTDVEIDIKATNGPQITTNASTEFGVSSKSPEGGKEYAKDSTVVVAVSIPVVVVVLAIVVFLSVFFRNQIRAKFRTNRQSLPSPFNSVSFTNIRSTAHLSSEENLTSVVSIPSRPTQLDIVESGHNEIVITPDRNQEKNLRNVSMAPESSNKEGRTHLLPDASEPELPPYRPPLPRLPPRPSVSRRPLSPKNKSLPDLLEDKSSFNQSSTRPSLESKAESFHALDKPTRPKAPKVPKLPSRQNSNVEEGIKANIKALKRHSSTPVENPGTSPTSDPLNRTALRKTSSNPKRVSDVSRRSSESSGDDRSDDTFRPCTTS